MPEPIEGEYFNWLCAKVLPTRSNQYLDLLRVLYQTEFVWKIPRDKNRSDDGCELRLYFLTQTRNRASEAWMNEPCSVLEMLLAFADRASFQTDIPPRNWFWEMVNNLGLGELRHMSRDDYQMVEEVLHAFIWRTYNSTGHGGLFPLQWPKRDQRKVEIWYQFCDYMEDRGLM